MAFTLRQLRYLGALDAAVVGGRPDADVRDTQTTQDRQHHAL